MSPLPDVDAAVAPSDKHRWVILGVLWITYIVVFLTRLGVGPLGAFFKDDLHITSAQVGGVMSAAAFGYLITQVPIGWCVDKIGARWPMGAGELIAGMAMSAVYFLPSYRALLTLVFVAGLGCGFLPPATTQAVVIWFPQRERATVMGVKQTAVSLGGIVAAATLPSVARAWGWRAGFLVLGLTAIVVGLLSLLMYREPGKPPSSSSNGTTPTAVSLLEIVKNGNIWLVAMGAFFLNWVEMAMIGHFVLYLSKGLLLSVVAAGGLLAMAETAGAVARPLGGWVSDRMLAGRRKPVFAFFGVTASLMSAVMAFWGSELGALLYPVVFVLGIGAVGFGGVYLTLLSELGGRGGAAKAAGLGSTIAIGGSILGPPSFGHIVDVSGSYSLAWLSLAAAGALSAIAVAFVQEPRRAL